MAQIRKFRCSECAHVWETAYGTVGPGECPKCRSKNTHRATRNRTLRFGISDKRNVSVCSEEILFSRGLLRPRSVLCGYLSDTETAFLRHRSASGRPNHPPTAPSRN